MSSYVDDLLIGTEKRLMRALWSCDSATKEEALTSLRKRFAIKNSFFDNNDKKLLQDSAECALGLSIQDALKSKHKAKWLGYAFNYVLSMMLALTPGKLKYI